MEEEYFYLAIGTAREDFKEHDKEGFLSSIRYI